MPVDTLAQNTPTIPVYDHATFTEGQRVRYTPRFTDQPHAGKTGSIKRIIGHSCLLQLDDLQFVCALSNVTAL